MRWASLLFCCLFLAVTFAGGGAPLLATDLKSPRPDDAPTAQDVGDFCYGQRKICRKICDLRSRFEDNFDGCPQSCESRVARCFKTGCYRWSEPEFLIAERFGGGRCPF